ncbi:acetylglutamate kinase [Floricoccus penangensis]|uniref:Acetylglutamate kinase n=1 Tax=Floricoccus penangensis TaxID=1859475 RepID=A0A9Q5P0M2_9LACT|nr:acetylglutamate kinase [Floricoccus penangensis]OFI47177.1 acetylglutamate kinase [Floricoccus penangensis]
MKTIVVKMGGVASDNLDFEFFQQIKFWQAQGHNIAIVHGGGNYISQMMEKMNVPVEKKNGLRVTNQVALDIARLALLGQVQPMLTGRFQAEHISALGLNAASDRLIEGHIIDFHKFGYVGQVDKINIYLLENLMEIGQVPIIAPLGMTEDGQWLNINADDVAAQVASQLQADELYLLTDVPGIKKENIWMKKIPTEEIDELKDKKIVTGGMLPKIESAKKALKAGVGAVFINNCISSKGTEIGAF